MTIREAIASIDRKMHNNYTREEKVVWLSRLDGQIFRDLYLTHEKPEADSGIIMYDPDDGDSFPGYDEGTSLDTVLLVPFPWDEIYPWYMEMKIAESNSETNKYNSAASRYNSGLEEYSAFYNSILKPIGKGDRFIF